MSIKIYSMNSEMLSFILFLLYSDDLRQQSDRVILELSKENDNRTKAVTDAIAEILKNENNLFSIKSQEYFSGQYNRIID